MTKQELMENYTTEQLADKIIALEITISDMKNTEKIIKQYNNKQRECEKSEKRTPFTDKELAEKWKKLAEELNDEGHKTIEENEKLKSELKHKENAIKQIDSIICELFGIAHNGDEYTEDFKELLRNQSAVGKTIVDFLPEEPIKVADMLISATYVRNKNELEKSIGKAFGNDSDTVTEDMYSVSELRQIAEHLLIYCNAHESEI